MVKRHKTNNDLQNTTQWSKDTGQTMIYKTQYTMVNRHKTNNDLQNTAQKTKDQETRTPKTRTDNTMINRYRTNSHLQNTTQKTKDRETRTPKTECELRSSRRVAATAPLVAPAVLLQFQTR